MTFKPYFCFLLFILSLIQPLKLHAQWTQTNGPEGGLVFDLAELNGRIFYCSKSGVYISDDNGATWYLKSNSLLSYEVRKIRTYENKIYVAARKNGFEDHLYRSDDLGETWVKISDFDFSVVFSIIIHENTILVSSFGSINGFTTSWVYRSSDSGLTWTDVTSGFPIGNSHQCRDFHFDNGAFYAGNSFGIFKSTNDGLTWTGLLQNADYEILELDVSGDTILAADFNHEVLLSTDGGSNWQTISLLANPSTYQTKDVMIRDGSFYAVSDFRIFRSVDVGETWEALPVDGVKGHFVKNNNWIYASSNIAGGGVWKSNDNGNTWETPSISGLIASSVSDMTALGNYIFARGGFAHITASGDGGQSWHDKSNGLEWPTSIGVIEAHKGKIYAGDTWDIFTYNPANDHWDLLTDNQFIGAEDFESTEEYLFAGGYNDLHRSPDEGDTWEKLPNFPLSNGFISHMNGTLFTGGYPGFVYSSTDMGETWETRKDFQAEIGNVSVTNIHPVGTELFATLSYEGLFRSSDGGYTWTEIEGPYAGSQYPNTWVRDIRVMTSIGNVLIIGVDELGLFMSYDFGATWIPINQGLWHPEPNDLIVGNDGYLYLSTNGAGIWRRRLDDFKFNKLKGTVYFDHNENGVRDTDEEGIQNILLQSSLNNSFATSDSSGNYSLYYTEAEPDTIKVIPHNLYSVVNPSYHIFSPTDSVKDFGIHLIPDIKDLKVTLTNNQPAIPGFEVQMAVTWKNIGTTIQSGSLKLKADQSYEFVSASIPPSSFDNGFIIWEFDSLKIFECRNLYTTFYLPPGSSSFGEILSSSATVLPFDEDANPLNNFDQTDQIVVGSYDPNDKQVVPNDPITPEQAQEGQTLTYTIRFQNTGTYQAFNIRILDTLSTNLDISTLQVLSASHPYTYSVRGNGILEFFFNNINLPDSTANELASHGFIKYSVDVRKNLEVGDRINNTAHIYFDFNEPIVTNTVSSDIDHVNGILETGQKWNTLNVYPNPATEVIHFITPKKPSNQSKLLLYDASGKILLERKGITIWNKINLSAYLQGIYLIKAEIDGEIYIGSFSIVK
ncbi:MAG TPA: T9SS type A sorting domain-containing protein [Bacteroidetes bacterium]|nr:T9SS type A sorting domain-containing protein [Bacteroidota bacterium]